MANKKHVADVQIVESEDSGDGNNVSSLIKTLGILDLFTPEKAIWSTTDILDALQVSRSTGYRYIKALTSVGLLSAVGNGYYVLGSRIIELDYQIRSTDPLLRSSEGVLEELVDATDHTAILCMLYQSSVLCISERRARLSPKSLFSRGQQRPLFRGAMSRIILAHLPNHRLRNIFSKRAEDIAAANLGGTWEEFRDILARIRSDGFVHSVGEFNPGVVGVAAPVFNVEGDIIGSVGVAWDQAENSLVDVARVILTVRRAGRELTDRMASSAQGIALQPRAVG